MENTPSGIEALDEQTLWQRFHLRRHPDWPDGTPHLSYDMFQTNPYKSFSYDVEEDEFRQLDRMYTEGANNDEILLWLHEKADAFLEEDERWDEDHELDVWHDN